MVFNVEHIIISYTQLLDLWSLGLLSLNPTSTYTYKAQHPFFNREHIIFSYDNRYVDGDVIGHPCLRRILLELDQTPNFGFPRYMTSELSWLLGQFFPLPPHLFNYGHCMKKCNNNSSQTLNLDYPISAIILTFP